MGLEVVMAQGMADPTRTPSVLLRQGPRGARDVRRHVSSVGLTSLPKHPVTVPVATGQFVTHRSATHKPGYGVEDLSFEDVHEEPHDLVARLKASRPQMERYFKNAFSTIEGVGTSRYGSASHTKSSFALRSTHRTVLAP